MIYEYWKGKLNAVEQRAYEDVLAAVSRRQERIPVKGVQPHALSQIHRAVYYDHPELFYMTHAPGVQQSVGLFGASVTFLCKSIFSPGVISTYQRKIEEVKASLAPDLARARNDYEKEKVVCDYLLRHVSYHIDNTLNQNAGTALAQGRAQCSGFAKAVKLLFDHIGIKCLIIDGEVDDAASGQRGPHAWNIVLIDGVWYHLDVTMMLGANTQKIEPFRYLYLNWSDAQMRAMHKWDATLYPVCNTEFLLPTSSGAGAAPSAPQRTQPSVPQRPMASAPVTSTPVSTSTSATVPSASTRVRKKVTSVAQFRRDIANVYRAHLRMFEFLSQIPVNSAQELLNTVLDAACDEAKKQNLQLSINVTVSGDVVKVELGW